MEQSSIKETWVNCKIICFTRIRTGYQHESWTLGAFRYLDFWNSPPRLLFLIFSTVPSRFPVFFSLRLSTAKSVWLVIWINLTILALDGIRLSINSLEMKDHLLRRWIMTALIIPDFFLTIQIMKGHFVSFRNQRITAFFLWPALHLPSWEDFFWGNYLEDFVSG